MDQSPTATATATAVIAARSERQAMDWSLVLASQGIEVAIERATDREWHLRVAEPEETRARAAIRLFRIENRGWDWHQPLPDSDLTFHWGAMVWVFVIAFIHGLPVDLTPAWDFDTTKVRGGEWWRAFTAVWLHADLAHLASNAVFGTVALGLAMSRYGAPRALGLAWLAGAAGNFLGMAIRSRDYHGVGASGLVLGAVGMLSIQAATLWRSSRRATRSIVTGLLSGGFLFLLLGTDPRGDLIAHAGGYATGVALGACATWCDWAAAGTAASQDRHRRQQT